MPSPQTEQRHPEALDLHLRPAEAASSLLLNGHLRALEAVAPALHALTLAAEAGAAALREGGRMGYAGAGSSGLMALADALELAGTFGLPPERTPILFAGGAEALVHLRGDVEDDAAAAEADLKRSRLGPGDLLIVVSASGTTPYALAVAKAARARGVKIAALANVGGSPLLGLAEIPVLLETPPEMVAGSTRLGAATAQKAALNLVSVLIGLRLGHVHEGHMVNLAADNAKLAARAARIVADLAGVPTEAAQAALARTGGQVKPAVLVARGSSPEAAAAALERSAGHLGPLLAERSKSKG